jgi:hypothetical protein
LASPRAVRWILGATIALLVVGVPVVYYRWGYTREKRLREVTPGVLYRSGKMTADGFRDTLKRYQIRTVINLMDEYPDPPQTRHYFSRSEVCESEVCRELGVRYLWLPPDLISRRKVPAERPKAIDRFLAVMDDPANHPVLIHCHAGLHRTGVMAAVYRMEYDGWTPARAIRELKDLGFGEFACSSSNDYILQYLLNYQRGLRRQAAE